MTGPMALSPENGASGRPERLTHVRHDIWFALRRIRLRPGHSAVVVLTLALGIGASLAVLGAIDAILLRPLPFADAGRLVRIGVGIPVPRLPDQNLSDISYRRMVQDSRTLAGAAAWTTRDANLIQQSGTQRLVVARVSASLFSVLRTQPAIGRAFATDEDVPGGPRALILSDRLWRSTFGADTSIVGQTVNLEGEPFTVVGVFAPTMSFPSRDVAAWEPLQLDPAAVNPFNLNYAVVGRLRDGISLAAAQADLTAPLQAVGREYPGPHPGSAFDPSGYSARVQFLGDSVAGDAKPVAYLLLAGVVALLLLASANVTNLQLAAATMRGEELAVRAALGASSARLIRGAVVEGVTLALAGTVVGIVVAMTGAGLVTSLLPPGVAPVGALLGARSIAFAGVLATVVGAAIGALPVLALAGRDPASGLRERAAGATSVLAGRLRRGLAAAQVALAVVLLYSSGLLVMSAQRVSDVRLGFQAEGALSLRLNLPSAILEDRSARETLLRRLSADIARLPGVTAVGLANSLPLTTGPRDIAMAVEGRPFQADGTDPIADFRIVNGGYFQAMGIAVTRGRAFTDDDATNRITPLMINETLARQLFPNGEDPIGQRLRFGPVAPWMPILGVVADAKNRSLTEAPRPELYTPALGTYSNLTLRSRLTLVVRSRTGGAAVAALAGPVRAIIADAAPDVAIISVATLDDVVRSSRGSMTTLTQLIVGYAIAAFLLAIAGTYAVLAYLVTQRRRELALRVALGATTRAIAGLVMGESARLTALGVALGAAGAVASARLMAGLLYGVTGLDPAVLGGVLLAAILAATLAAIVPARRALRADPASVFRSGP
jgi:putative ABC transport system permease protein